MRSIYPLFLSHSRAVLAATFVAAGAALAPQAQAVDLIGLYVGGAVGRASVEAQAPAFGGNFKEDATAWKVLVGVRPISLLGAELAYVNLGNPDGQSGTATAEGKVKGGSAFGLFYVPIPLPFLDVFVKAGVSRLESSVTGTSPAGAFRFDSNDTGFAAGAGAQLKFGSLAIRAEYERFDAGDANPTLLSLGLTKTFL